MIQLYIYIYYIYILFLNILIHYGLSSQCYTVGPCCLSIMYIITSSANPNPPLDSSPNPFPLATTSLFSLSVTLFLFCRQVQPNEYLKIMMQAGKDRWLKHITKVRKEMCLDKRNASYHRSKFSLTIKAD